MFYPLRSVAVLNPAEPPIDLETGFHAYCIQTGLLSFFVCSLPASVLLEFQFGPNARIRIIAFTHRNQQIYLTLNSLWLTISALIDLKIVLVSFKVISSSCLNYMMKLPWWYFEVDEKSFAFWNQPDTGVLHVPQYLFYISFGHKMLYLKALK